MTAGEKAYNAYNNYLYDVSAGTDEELMPYPPFSGENETRQYAWEEAAMSVLPAPELTDAELRLLHTARERLKHPVPFLIDQNQSAALLVKLADALGVSNG